MTQEPAQRPPPPPLLRRPHSCCEHVSRWYGAYETAHEQLVETHLLLYEAEERIAALVDMNGGGAVPVPGPAATYTPQEMVHDYQGIARDLGEWVQRRCAPAGAGADMRTVLTNQQKLLASVTTVLKKSARSPLDEAALAQQRERTAANRKKLQDSTKAIVSQSWPRLVYLMTHTAPVRLEPTGRGKMPAAMLVDAKGGPVECHPSTFHLISGDLFVVTCQVESDSSMAHIQTAILAALAANPHANKATRQGVDANGKTYPRLPGVLRHHIPPPPPAHRPCPSRPPPPRALLLTCHSSGGVGFVLVGPWCQDRVNMRSSVLHAKVMLARAHADEHGVARNFELHMQVLTCVERLRHTLYHCFTVRPASPARKLISA